jgi:hypothetical protein
MGRGKERNWCIVLMIPCIYGVFVSAGNSRLETERYTNSLDICLSSRAYEDKQ